MAGVPIYVDDLDIKMIHCLKCGYYFVTPCVPQERLRQCYMKSGDHWLTGDDVAQSRNYSYKAHLISQYVNIGDTILSIGCYDGGLEHYIGEKYDWFGIEPSSQASAKARENGVDILGETIDDVKGIDKRFDAVMLFDVAEHIEDPLNAFGLFMRSLKDGGVIIFETGNMDSFPWKEEITLNPYCALYEHVGFFNASSVNKIAELLGMDVMHFEETIHSNVNGYEAYKRKAKLSVYWILKMLGNMPGMPSRLVTASRGPIPVPPVQRDHFIAVLKKKDE